jgi:16S rRNA (cytosine967-C5)-methyltransferase
MPGYSEGYFQVQDEAAQLIGHILSPGPGETILDACAGLGGKTSHVAQLMQNRGVLHAMDRNPRKLSLLQKEMKRLGITIVQTCRHDLLSPPDQFPHGFFDRILLDAPCSGLGVLRRNPDAKWRVSEKDIERLREIQLSLLFHLAPLLKPSGILVYAVCSTEPEENEFVIDEFLKSQPDFKSNPLDSSACIPMDCITENGYFKTYPHHLSMDGFFAARLKRVS